MNWRTKIKDLYYTKRKTVAFVAGGVIVALLIFHAGVSVGERRAFSHIHAGYPFPPQRSEGFLPHGFMPEGHGAVGTITRIELPVLTLQTRDGRDTSVRVSSSTPVRSATEESSINNLKVGDNIIVVGSPDEKIPDNLDAKLIRILNR